MTGWTRIYGPHGQVAHLSAPGAVAAPLCAARAKPPAGGWLGTLGTGQGEVAASLPACKHCERMAAARATAPDSSRPQQPGQVTAEAGTVTSPAPPPDDAPTPPAAAGDAAEAPGSLLIPCSPGPAAGETPAGGVTVRDAPPAGPATAEEITVRIPLAVARKRRSFADWLLRRTP